VALAAAAIVLAAGGWWWSRAGAVTEVETVRATVQQPSQAQAGAPILTASGYVVARRKAVVSAKIQGRLAELRVEEGSRVAEGETIARLESADFEANLVRARARVESVRLQIEAYAARIRSAEVNLAEARRQAGVAERLWAERWAPSTSATPHAPASPPPSPRWPPRRPTTRQRAPSWHRRKRMCASTRHCSTTR
jgi:multidrug efflux pump subunit AcrA (membrane-fusion protein)